MPEQKPITPAANRINDYARRFEATKYLEIGVSAGATFFSVNMPLKIAVDPNFRFDPGQHAQNGVLFLPITSDEFFSTFPEHPQASLYLEPDGSLAFDIIYIDGLHTFEQSLRDFENSLKFCHRNTIWILDDTVPCDVFSAIPDQKFALESRKRAGLAGSQWHGDVFKTLLAIHDFYPGFSYCTVMKPGNPQTVLWQAPVLPDRQPRFASNQEIAALGYLAVLEHADLFLPVNADLASVLIGKSLAPALYGDHNTWTKMLYSRHASLKEAELQQKLKNISLSVILKKIILRLITPVVKKLTSAENFQKFKDRPSVLLDYLKKRKGRIFGEIYHNLKNKDSL